MKFKLVEMIPAEFKSKPRWDIMITKGGQRSYF